MGWLVALTMINAAISAAYYLRIVATMFLGTETKYTIGADPNAEPHLVQATFPIVLSITMSVAATLLLGIALPATQSLYNEAQQSARMNEANPPAVTLSANR
jgi:NADH-quinone oxidoreductase subunit N